MNIVSVKTIHPVKIGNNPISSSISFRPDPSLHVKRQKLLAVSWESFDNGFEGPVIVDLSTKKIIGIPESNISYIEFEANDAIAKKIIGDKKPADPKVNVVVSKPVDTEKPKGKPGRPPGKKNKPVRKG